MSAHASPDGGDPPAPGHADAIPLQGIGALAERFDGFILDQWGVLHDGVRPYAGAADCLQALKARGKRIVVLSNSGRREADNIELMRAMGLGPRSYDRLVSAGEAARDAILARADAFHRALGRCCYAFTRGGDREVLEGIGIAFADRIASADFLAVLGIDTPQRRLADYERELQAGIARHLPMVCANPDLWRFSGDGMIEAAGVLAQRYETLGGAVFYHGKPHPAIYAVCLDALGCDRARVVAIGDSIEHDILGARRVGIRSALVTGGVHRAALGIAWGELPAPQAWQRLAADAVARPDYLLPAFVW